MYQKRYFTFILAVLTTLATSNLFAVDALAVKDFQAAISACEQGLQSEMPKSSGSLRVLQSSLSRYQRNKNSALTKDSVLKDSTSERYTGSFFVGKTFKEAYEICESVFVPKVSQAEAIVAKQLEERQARQAEQKAIIDELIKKVDASLEQVTSAINICTGFLRAPIPNMLQSPQYKEYQAAKAKALAIYPQVVKQFRDATYLDQTTGEETTASKTVQFWFDYCEDVFTTPATATEKVGPPSPPVDVPSTTEGKTTKPISKESVKKSKTETVVPPTNDEDTEVLPENATTKPIAPPIPKESVKKSKTEIVVPPTNEDDSEVSPKSLPIKGETGEIPSKATPAKKEVEPAPSADDDAAADEEYAKEVAAEYQKALSQVHGDRLKVLQENKRVPEFVDDEDNDLQKANTWQYEDKAKCTAYSFKGDKLLKPKVTPGECPAFDQ
ncbi:MAG: hypothetical protein BWK79_04520 [Beggiatoa sp. IS2]|nr:MAG: hypothetical protein BWK79_04520 [Beggiatoa sp. IS2]